MTDYLFDIEVVRFAFVAGIAVSLVLYERRHLTTGSLVVPGYVAVFLIQPLVIAATVFNALITYWFVNRVLARRVLLYGRTKYSVLALVSIAIQATMLKLSPTGPYLWESDVPIFVGAGYVIPALVAHDMARQGVGKTLRSVLLAGGLVAAPIALALWTVPGVQASAPLVGFEVLAVPPDWVPAAVFLSAAAAWGLFHNHRLRAGGFGGAAYLGMLSADPLQIVFVVSVAAVTYMVVTRLLQPWMILFGRRKFSAMLLVSAIVAWCTMWFGTAVLGYEISYYTTLSSVALTPLFVPGLVANDMERSGVLRVVAGTVLGAAFVVPGILAVVSVLETGTLSLLWTLTSLLAGSVIFHPQIRWLGGQVLAGILRLVFGGRGRHRPPVVRPASVPAASSVPMPSLPAAPPTLDPTPTALPERELASR